MVTANGLEISEGNDLKENSKSAEMKWKQSSKSGELYCAQRQKKK